MPGSPRDRRLLDVEVVDADRVADLDECLPTGPDARILTMAVPRVLLAMTAPTYLLS